MKKRKKENKKTNVKRREGKTGPIRVFLMN